MNDNPTDLAQAGEDILGYDPSDEALEAAAGPQKGGPMLSWADTLSLTLRPCC